MLDVPIGPDSVREVVREIADTRLRSAAAEVDRTEAYPFGHAKALAEAGINGMTIPVEYGGSGASFETTCIAVEEAAKACGISGRIVVDTNMGAVPAIMTYGTEAQKRRTAELVLAGDKPAICFTEPKAGSDATAMQSRADRDGNGYILNGVKYWITGGGITQLYLVLAHVYHGADYQGIGSFLIEDGTAGLRVGERIPAMGLRGIPESYLHLENCTVPETSLLMPPAGLKKGFGQIMRAYNS
ncbi:MAG: acyl-CoA dehydrogenase family protein, partial [Pseudomonadota bacterium]